MEIINRKAKHDFELLDFFTCGIVLVGTEIKSIREGKVSFTDTYCYFQDNQLLIKNLHISEYEFGSYNNHDPKRDKILLLNKNELRKIRDKISENGLTIIPTKLFINEKGWAKVDIAIAKGKKNFDKREDIKDRDNDRELKKVMKEYTKQ